MKISKKWTKMFYCIGPRVDIFEHLKIIFCQTKMVGLETLNNGPISDNEHNNIHYNVMLNVVMLEFCVFLLLC